MIDLRANGSIGKIPARYMVESAKNPAIGKLSILLFNPELPFGGPQNVVKWKDLSMELLRSMPVVPALYDVWD